MIPREQCRVGMRVRFGRERGQHTLGVIEKVNRVKCKVRTEESRGARSGPGAIWNVPYSMLYSVDGEVATTPVSVPPNFPLSHHDRTDEPFPYNEFGDPAVTHIMQAINCVYADLSPENLTCDGEIDMGTVRVRRNQLDRRLKGLFAALGREVSETVAFNWLREFERAQNNQSRSGRRVVTH